MSPPDGGTGAPGPLHGLRVLDIGTVYAAPISAMLLGDLGADVIKVEHPNGDPARTHGESVCGEGLWWKVIARNKRTVTLDLSNEAAVEPFFGLVRRADVLIENFRPGVLEAWGLGPDILHEINPRLIILRLTGFGQDGPYAQRRAFGTLIEAMSGFAHQTGMPDGPPTLPPFGLADGVAGIAGALACVSALYHRDAAGGDGQVIDMSLLEPLLGILGPGPSAFQQLGIIPGRFGNRSPNNAPRNVFRTQDDRWVAISSSTTSVARRVMSVVGCPGICIEPWFESARGRAQHHELLDGMVGRWISRHTLAEVIREFTESGAAVAPVNNVADLMGDPQVVARKSIIEVHDEDLGTLAMQNVMFRFARTPASIRFPGRRLGQDSVAVFEDLLGMSAAVVEDLKRQGAM
ncbi:CaiB/BaiF CoA transferase family protein [Mycolicibacterium sp.]|uniref:CaiB/BaiF CoA transferase family protein n=1 Tax=Mycolicibacterium sp. TaxID=2320850 RepID=UPI003D0DD902